MAHFLLGRDSMTGIGRSRWLFVVAAAVAAAVAVAVVAAGGQGNGSSSVSRFDPRKEAAFEGKGLEAQRKGPSNPATEQVENRAYPRAYVDDRLALKSHDAFSASPRSWVVPRSARGRHSRPHWPLAPALGPPSGRSRRTSPGRLRSSSTRSRSRDRPHRSPGASPRSRSTPTAQRPPLRPARPADSGSRPRVAGSGARTTRSPLNRAGSRLRTTSRRTPSAR